MQPNVALPPQRLLDYTLEVDLNQLKFNEPKRFRSLKMIDILQYNHTMVKDNPRKSP